MARYFSFFLTITAYLIFSTENLAQTHTLSGRVKDSETGEYILGATVISVGESR